MEYKCYRCGKEASFFFLNRIDEPRESGGIFYNYISYWDKRKIDLSYYPFVCSSCVVLEIALSKLRGEAVQLRRMSEDKKSYLTESSLENWLQS